MTAKFVWRRGLEVMQGNLEGVVKKRQLTVAKAIFDGVVQKTPVRTGSARASWRAATGSPDLSVTRSENAGSPLPAPVFSLESVPLYAKIYITNATSYIVMLEYGWSDKAPTGMVRVTLAELGIGLSVRE